MTQVLRSWHHGPEMPMLLPTVSQSIRVRFAHLWKIPRIAEISLGATTTTMLRRASSIPLPSRLACWPTLKTVNNLAPLICRGYSTASPAIADMNSANVTVENTSSPKGLTPQSQLVFGHTFTGRLLLLTANAVRPHVDH